MDVVRPEFVPDPTLSHEEMEALQREIAASATFSDDVTFDTGDVCGGNLNRQHSNQQTTLLDDPPDHLPLVAGVDQAFIDDEASDGDRAVSAIVVSRGDEVVERVSAVVDNEIPYIPGLLSFREGGAIVAAFEQLESDPDLVLFDGSGRIHYREAGLATHVGCIFDLPTIGVAKGLLCGTPSESLDEKHPVGAHIPIESNERVETAGPGTVIGYAVQTRQYETADRYVNPLYVSPGHRIGADTAASIVLGCCDGYKLPEPTRRADSYAAEAKAEYLA